MSFDDLKEHLNASSTEERTRMLFYLKHLLKADFSANRDELSRAHREIETGTKLTLKEVKRIAFPKESGEVI